jgi:hypothetical protein
MEFELQGFKFSLTVDEIKQIVGLIKENIDRDKKNLCLLLYLTNEVILDWYNTIIKGVPPQLLIRIAAENRSLTKDELSDLTRFIQQKEFTPLVEEIRGLLYDVEIGNQKLRDQVGSVRWELHMFIMLAQKKVDWLNRAVREGKWDISAQEVLDWENTLDPHRREIRERIRPVQTSLNCLKEMIGKFLTELTETT